MNSFISRYKIQKCLKNLWILFGLQTDVNRFEGNAQWLNLTFDEHGEVAYSIAYARIAVHICPGFIEHGVWEGNAIGFDEGAYIYNIAKY